MKTLALSMSLTGIQAPVWRHMVVPASYHFADLAEVFKIAAGYQQDLVWEFLFDELKARITNDEALIEQAKYLQSDAGKAHLSNIDRQRHEIDVSVAVARGSEVPIGRLFETYKECRFLYDTTDEWIWQVRLLEEMGDTHGQAPPFVYEGMGTAPFEEMGGLAGYEEVVALLVDEGEGAEEIRRWMEEQGCHFFDLADVNDALRRWAVKKSG